MRDASVWVSSMSEVSREYDVVVATDFACPYCSVGLQQTVEEQRKTSDTWSLRNLGPEESVWL